MDSDYYAPGVKVLGQISFTNDYVAMAKDGMAPYHRHEPLADQLALRTSGVTLTLLNELGVADGPLTWYELPAYPVPGYSRPVVEATELELVTGVVGVGHEEEHVVLVEDFATRVGYLTREFVVTPTLRRARFEAHARESDFAVADRSVRWTAEFIEQGATHRATYTVHEQALKGLYGIRCVRLAKVIAAMRRLEEFVRRQVPEAILRRERDVFARIASEASEAFANRELPGEEQFDVKMTAWLQGFGFAGADIALLLKGEPVPSALAKSEWVAQSEYLGGGCWSLPTVTIGQHDLEGTLIAPFDVLQNQMFEEQTRALAGLAERVQRITLPHIRRSAIAYNRPLRW